MPVAVKLCTGRCGEPKPIALFWLDANAPDGHMSRCIACEKEAREQAKEAKAAGERGEDPGKRGYFSPEERERRSALARRMHAEGRFGGALIGRAGGSAPRRRRITDAVLEHFRQPDEQELIIQTIRKALKGKNRNLGSRVAFQLLATEEKVAERERADRGGVFDPDSKTDDELREFLEQAFATMIARGEMPVDLELSDDAVQDIG
jgi:hypothetical protein